MKQTSFVVYKPFVFRGKLTEIFLYQFHVFQLKMRKNILFGFMIVFMFLLFNNITYAQDTVCSVYFTGIGCPHCANSDTVVLKDALIDNDNLIVIEYEIYQLRENAPLITDYNDNYNTELGVPLLIFNEDYQPIGDRPIIQGVYSITSYLSNNDCPLPDGTKKSFHDLNISSLPGKPKIWHKNKVLIKKGSSGDEILLKDLLLKDNITEVLENKTFELIEPENVPLSGSYLPFENAVKVDDWVFQWNGDYLNINGENNTGNNSNINGTITNGKKTEITWAKIMSLAAVDAVNPCALAVLILMLTAILSYNPKSKRNLLLAGFAFVIAVFVMYFIYGLIIIKCFQIVQALTSVRVWLYKLLGAAAVILGLFNIKDFISYKPGSIGTEMPLFLRPKVKRVISGVTSPKGAFIVGLFVTLFLLPCTIGPYIITGGILCSFAMLHNIVPLLLYNLVFVFPMVLVVFVVYQGFRNVDDINKWKEKHITHLHLAAGIIMVLLGIAMFLGLV